jgi:uncharacterized membrane protein
MASAASGEDTKKRSLVKAFTWRAFAFVLLGAISYVITGSLKEMTIITVVYNLLQVLFYYLHERLWMQVHWGRREHPLSTLPVTRALAPDDMEAVKEHLRQLGYIE